MKNITAQILIILSTILLMVSCSKEDEVSGKPNYVESKGEMSVFYASTEVTDNPNRDTKVYADEYLLVLWNENDSISIFNKRTYNDLYVFTGEDGDTGGGFEEIPASGFISGNNLDHIYAVYPYSKLGNKINNVGSNIMVNLPSEQKYKEHSFGIGSNTMVAVTDDNFLSFKNVGGYLSLRLYGDDIAVSRITLTGNNGEKIAGKASIAISSDTNPVVTMDETATESITIICDSAITIGSSSTNYTDFLFVIPPTEFTNGFTITITDDLGGTFEKSTNKSFTVTRNKMDWMSPLKVEPTYKYVPIKDEKFRAYCLENFDTDIDGKLSIEEALSIERIDINVAYEGISSLRGIEYFSNLTYLDCSGYWDDKGLTSLDISKNTALTYLNCQCNQINVLDVSNNTALTYLDCYYNQLTSLDVSNNAALTFLNCGDNQLTALDISNNTALTFLNCGDNQLTALDISNNTALTTLGCGGNQLTALDLSMNTSLTVLRCAGNLLTSLDVSNLSSLCILDCNGNQLTSLDVSNCTSLTDLYCSDNQLTSLNVNGCTALTYLICLHSKLDHLDVSNCTSLTDLYCSDNQLTCLNVNGCTALKFFDCSNNQLTCLDVSTCTALALFSCSSNQLATLDVSNNGSLYSLKCNLNEMTSLDVSNCTALKEIQCDNNFITFLNVSNCTALENLNCFSNLLTSLNISTCLALKGLNCGNNQLMSLDVSNCTALTGLYCYSNQLACLYVSNLSELTTLNCYSNQLTNLYVSNLSELTSLVCYDNKLDYLDVSNCTKLTNLSCHSNQLTSLNVSDCTALTKLNCHNNLLTSLDVIHNPALSALCAWPQYQTTLSDLWIKRGQVIKYYRNNYSKEISPSDFGTRILEVE